MARRTKQFAGPQPLRISVHFPEKPRRNTEATLKGVRKALGWEEANLGGDGFEGNATRQQKSCFIKPQLLDKARRRATGRLDELPVERTFGERGAGRQGPRVQRLVKV